MSEEEPENFLPCPILRLSCDRNTDTLDPLREKMQEYLNSCLRLDWLINPQEQQVEIYQPIQPVATVQFPVS